MIESFYNTPIYREGNGSNPHIYLVTPDSFDIQLITQALANNKLLLCRGMTVDSASEIFGELVDFYDLRESYDIQMQLVVHMMEGRESVDEVAVTVNERGPFEIIQPHSEGDSSSPLDLFGLHCSKNAEIGGENILSLINQDADHTTLLAKEKVIVCNNPSESAISELRREHFDAKEVVASLDQATKILKETENGSVVVRTVAVKPSTSIISGEELITYWDNVTVHDHAFHKFQYQLLKQLGLLHQVANEDYQHYLHIETDSNWAPVDTNSGSTQETAQLFECHVVHKMSAGEFLIFNNKAWTHSVNNWPERQIRQLSAMYA